MSDQPSKSATADDFIHLVMDRSSTSSLISSFNSSKSQYSQVVFHNLSEVYPTDGDITFAFSFQQGVIPQEGDRVALYKVGWTSVSQFSASKFVKLAEDGSHTSTIKITFPVEDLPKDEENMYQFCYVSCGNIVAGSSIPFTFRKPLGSELVAVEDPNDSGLIVFRSQVTQLQEELLKVNTDNEVLDNTNKQYICEIDSLKSELKEMNRKCELHKESIHNMTVVIHDVNVEKMKLKEQLEGYSNVRQQLKEVTEAKELLEGDLTSMASQINMLEKQLQDKEATIELLNQNSKAFQKMTDEVNEEVDEKNARIRLLEQRIKDIIEKVNSHKAESLVLSKDLEKASNDIKSLEEIVKIKDETIKKFSQFKDRKQMEDYLSSLSELNTYLSTQVQNVEALLSDAELQNTTLQEEKSNLITEKEQMAEQIMKLNNELLNLKRCRPLNNGCNSTTQEQQRGDSNRSMPFHPGPAQSPFDQITQMFHKLPQHLYEATGFRSDAQTESSNQNQNTSDSASSTPDCIRCSELDAKVKSLLVEKADVRSELIQTKHSFEERDRELKEVNEVAAALKSRISVLELELRKAKEVVILNQGEKKYNHMYGAISGTEPCLTLSKSSINNIDEQKELKNLLQKEVETKNLLQRNVEALMLSEARNHATIEKLEKENVRLSTELNFMKENVTILNEMRRGFNNIVSSKEEMAKSLQLLTIEKGKLENQLIELMKDSVGKVSLSTLQQIKDENEKLKDQLADKECSKIAKESGKAEGLSGESSNQEQMNMDGFNLAPSAPSNATSNPFTNLDVCPICQKQFPPNSVLELSNHIREFHFD